MDSLASFNSETVIAAFKRSTSCAHGWTQAAGQSCTDTHKKILVRDRKIPLGDHQQAPNSKTETENCSLVRKLHGASFPSIDLQHKSKSFGIYNVRYLRRNYQTFVSYTAYLDVYPDYKVSLLQIKMTDIEVMSLPLRN